MDTTLLLLLVLVALPSCHSQDVIEEPVIPTYTLDPSGAESIGTIEDPAITKNTLDMSGTVSIGTTEEPAITKNTLDTSRTQSIGTTEEPEIVTLNNSVFNKEPLLIPIPVWMPTPCITEGDCFTQYKGQCVDSRYVKCREIVPDYKARCGFTKDSTCVCCIDCVDYKRCSKTGAVSVCRKECRAEEFIQYDYDPANCTTDLCRCCEPCKPGKCEGRGRCVGRYNLCDGKEYIDGYCENTRCFCCVPCKTSDSCRKRGGQCVNYRAECPCGYKATKEAKCDNGHCKCCVPCTILPECTGQSDTGMCVPGPIFCQPNEFISNEKCCEGDIRCLYCKPCSPEKSCSDEDGICLREGTSCGPEMVQSLTGKCSSCQCICCVPDPCPTSCACQSRPNPGTCKKLTDCDEYITGDECIVRGCLCHRKCIPDQNCRDMKGKCSNAQTGCTGDYVKTDKATCEDSDQCVCCVPKVVMIPVPVTIKTPTETLTKGTVN